MLNMAWIMLTQKLLILILDEKLLCFYRGGIEFEINAQGKVSDILKYSFICLLYPNDNKY